MVAAVRIGSPWIYVQAMPEAVLRSRILPSLLPNAVLGLALLAMFIAAQWLLARKFVRPALAVLDYLQRLSDDPTQVNDVDLTEDRGHDTNWQQSRIGRRVWSYDTRPQDIHLFDATTRERLS